MTANDLTVALLGASGITATAHLASLLLTKARFSRMSRRRPSRNFYA